MNSEIKDNKAQVKENAIEIENHSFEVCGKKSLEFENSKSTPNQYKPNNIEEIKYNFSQMKDSIKRLLCIDNDERLEIIDFLTKLKKGEQINKINLKKDFSNNIKNNIITTNSVEISNASNTYIIYSNMFEQKLNPNTYISKFSFTLSPNKITDNISKNCSDSNDNKDYSFYCQPNFPPTNPYYYYPPNVEYQNFYYPYYQNNDIYNYYNNQYN